MTTEGVRRIAIERHRQITGEGWTPEHDDEHTDSSLAIVAALYANPESRDDWPESWAPQWDKRANHGRMRRLEIAGALIAAEIDRILRKEAEEINQ